MKFKNIIITIVFAMCIILTMPNISNASLYLNDLEFDAQINEDGSMNVTEIWNIDISETNTLYKTFKLDNSKYSEITDVKVTEITENINKSFNKTNTWEYHLDKDYYFGGINNEGRFEIAWGVSLDNSRDTRKYKITYTVKDVIAKYNDCAELYWQFIGEDFEINAEKVSGMISLPNEVDTLENIKVWGHIETLNGEIYAKDNNTIEFCVNKYRKGNYLEIRVAMPKEIIGSVSRTYNKEMLSSIIAEETNWAEEANAKREARDRNCKIICIISIVILVLETIWLFSKTKKYLLALKKYPKQKPEVEYEYYRELPDETATPTEASFIINESLGIHFSEIFSAVILDLTLKKYIKLEPDKKNINIEILQKDNEELPTDELAILELLKSVSRDNKLTMKELEKYIEKHPSKLEKLKEKLDKTVKKQTQKKQIFDAELSKKASKYIAGTTSYIFTLIITMFIPMIIWIEISYSEVKTYLFKYILIFSIFNFIIALVNTIMTSKLSYRLRGITQKGINEKNKWKAFKKYMEEFSLLNEKEVPALTLWEKYLVYATAFGIAEKVLKQLKIRYTELNDSKYINDMVLFNVLYDGHGMNTDFISRLDTSTSRMYSSTFSSGSGGGGGFSGGGGGRRSAVEAGGGR